MKHVMLDLETLGIGSNAVIVSISAVAFDMDGTIGDKFEIGLNIQTQIDNGGSIDASTVMWWLGQSKEAQKELLRLKQVHILHALSRFNNYLKNVDPSKLWGNSSTFDNVILRNLCAREGVELYVQHWNDRCVRTYVDDFKINKDITFIGVKHRGIDDCIHQIRYMTGETND